MFRQAFCGTRSLKLKVFCRIKGIEQVAILAEAGTVALITVPLHQNHVTTRCELTTSTCSGIT